jgi:hypothetical protein
VHRRIFRKAAGSIRARFGIGWPQRRALILGLLCVGVPFGLAGPALGQTLPFAQVPDPVPADKAPVASDESREAMEETSAQLAQQRADLAKLREEFEGKLGEERAAREAAEARAEGYARAEVEAALKANPQLARLEWLTVSGFVQADLNVNQTSQDQLNSSSGAPLNDNRFLIRRARLSAAVDQRYLAGVIELDANTVNGAQVRPMDVEATVKWPGGSVPLLALTAGLFKIPFGFEVIERDRDRIFSERSTFIRALFPGEYDLGARLAGGWRFVRYALAVQNGEPLGESTFPVRDPNQAKDITGRLGIVSEVAKNVKVQAGFSGLTGKGFHKGTPPTKPTLTWMDLNENGQYAPGELMVSPGTSGQPSQNFSRYAVGADALVSVRYLKNSGTTIYAEFARANNLDRWFLVADPYGPLGRDLREWGYYLAAVQDLGRHFQLGLRYDYYNPDLDSTDRQAGELVLSSQAVSTVSAAAALVGKAGGISGRIVAEYDWVADHQGRDSTGIPTDLKNNVFTLRGEVAF